MKNTSCVMLISFFTNFFLSIVKVMIGLISKSSALVADGIHSFSDLITDVVALFGNVLARKPEDQKHPFGHGRIEYVTSAMIGLIVVGIGCILIGSVLQKDVEIPSKIVIIVSLFTILSKFILSRYLMQRGKELDNQILIASWKESSTDVISSIVVFIASILIQLEGYFHPFIYADKIASVLVGLFIVHTGFIILKENVSILIGEKESDTIYYEEVENIILQSTLVHHIDNLIIMKYGYFYSLTVEVSMYSNLSLKEAHDEIEMIEKNLKEENERTKYIHIHMNPYSK